MTAAHSIPEELVRKIEIMTYTMNPHPLAVIMKDELIDDIDMSYFNVHDEAGLKWMLDPRSHISNKHYKYLNLRWKWYNSFGFTPQYKEWWGSDSDDE